MKSATPKLLHRGVRPHGAGLDAGARWPSSARPRGRGRAARRSTSWSPILPDWASRRSSPAQPLGTGDAVRSARAGAGGLRGRGGRPERRPSAHRPASLRDLVAAHGEAGAAASVLTLRPHRRASARDFGRIVRGPDGELERIVEAARRVRRASGRSPRSAPASTSSTPTCCGRRSSGWTRRQRPGRAVPDRRRSRSCAATATASSPTPRRPHHRPRGQHRADLAEAARAAARRINLAPHAGGCDHHRPGVDLDRRPR